MNTVFVADMIDQELGHMRMERERVRALLALLPSAREWSTLSRSRWPMPAASDLYALALIYRRLLGYGIEGAPADRLVRDDLARRTRVPLAGGRQR